MKQVRYSVFETNSSSTHSLTMCMESEYDAWENGQVYLNESWSPDSTSIYKDKKFVTKEEIIDILASSKYAPAEDLTALDSDEFDDCVREYEFYTFENYENEYLEWYDDRFTTPNGETVVCFGQYGYEG